MSDEIAVRTGSDTLSILFDMDKFDDNIDILKLIERADRQTYPALILNLGLQMHMAPRGLRCYRHCPGQVRPNHGIIAGCTQSTTVAKIDLKVVLQGLWDKYHTEMAKGITGKQAEGLGNDIRSFVDVISVTTHSKRV